MAATKKGGYMALKLHLLNGRLFNRLLSNDGRALYNAEQGKILSALWMKHPQTATELSQITGLANSTLTLMLKRLENEQGLIYSFSSEDDRRKKLFDITELGATQEEVGNEISDTLSNIFYNGFSDNEIDEFEEYLQRILENLQTALNEIPRNNEKCNIECDKARTTR